MADKPEFWRWTESRWTNPDIDWKGKVITAGVDVGSVSSQGVILADGELYAYSNMRTGSDSPDSAMKAINWAMEKTGMKLEDIVSMLTTNVMNRVYSTSLQSSVMFR